MDFDYVILCNTSRDANTFSLFHVFVFHFLAFVTIKIAYYLKFINSTTLFRVLFLEQQTNLLMFASKFLRVKVYV